jgi:hypothetical protein
MHLRNALRFYCLSDLLPLLQSICLRTTRKISAPSSSAISIVAPAGQTVLDLRFNAIAGWWEMPRHTPYSAAYQLERGDTCGSAAHRHLALRERPRRPPEMKSIGDDEALPLIQLHTLSARQII